jgi:hypothetical protein
VRTQTGSNGAGDMSDTSAGFSDPVENVCLCFHISSSFLVG